MSHLISISRLCDRNIALERSKANWKNTFYVCAVVYNLQLKEISQMQITSMFQSIAIDCLLPGMVYEDSSQASDFRNEIYF